MSMRIGFLGSALAVLIGMSLPAAGATVLINGSFEDGVPGNTRGTTNNARFGNLPVSGPRWDTWTSLDGWSLSSGTGIGVETNRTRTFIDAQDGNYYVALDRIGNSTIVQNVALGVGKYTLSLWYSPSTNNAGTNGVSYGITGLGGAMATVGTGGATRGQWTQFVLDLMVTVAGNYQVYLGATGSSNSRGALVDNISLAPVPLPAAGLALLGGLGALAGVRRRQRKG
jgi:hypothetical protein